MKKIVSIAVFGETDKYQQYLPAFVRAHLNLFPLNEDWRLRIHVGKEVMTGPRGAFLRKLGAAGLVELAPMSPAPLTRAMLWRMAPVFEDGVDYVFSRDLDACPMPRDRAVCDQFIASRATVNTCHDNLAHAGIMGGLCGFDAPAFRKATGLRSLEDLHSFAGIGDSVWALHGTDQNVLNRLINRDGGPTLLEHRFNGWTEGRPTPYRRDAAIYACPAWSTPTPDVGTSALPAWLVPQADKLANHLGAAGFDHLSARLFWDKYGDYDTANAVVECESL